MKIAGHSSIAACEKSLIELSHAVDDEPIQMPTNLRHTAGGAEASLAQVIVTWAQGSAKKKLETYISSPDGRQLQDFVRRFPALVASICAEEIVGLPPTLDLTSSAKKAALDRLTILQSRRVAEAFRGLSTEVICADHIGRGTPYLLYNSLATGGAALRSRADFRSLSRWLLKKSVGTRFQGPLVDTADEAIGGLLYELFKNTEDHALVDAAKNLLGTSIRAIRTNHFDIEPGTLGRIVQDYPPLATYCKSLLPSKGRVQTHFFELSVLDSGPGFASSWTKRPLAQLSDAEEEEAVRQCFERGSSKPDSHYGEGLPHVLRVLAQERGFLRLRTGRIALFADFSNPDLQPEANLLRRFTPPNGELAPVAGSLLTIILPLRPAA